MKTKASKKHVKPTRRAKGGKFHHKMKRHFDDGGDIDVGSIDTSGQMPDIDDAMSRGMAYKLARSAGKKTFMWRGKTYTTESAEEAAARKAAAAPAAPAPSAAPMLPPVRTTGPIDDRATAERLAPTRVGGYAGPSAHNRITGDDLRALGKGAMLGTGILGGVGALPEMVGLGAEGFLGEGGADALAGLARSSQARKAALARAAQLRATRPIQDVIRQATARGAGYRKGGKVHKYAAGGSIRGGGCESKGKTKGTHR
jgi:hypothetical protein